MAPSGLPRERARKQASQQLPLNACPRPPRQAPKSGACIVVTFYNIPVELLSFPHWACHDEDKVPVNPITRQYIKTNHHTTWCDYQVCHEAVVTLRYKGLGPILTGQPIGAFDCDKCRNPVTCEIDPEILQIIRWSNSYTEIIPSGTGLRTIGKADGLYVSRKQPLHDVVSIESYRQAKRFITLTGNHLDGTPTILNNIDDKIDYVVSYLDKRSKPSAEIINLYNFKEKSLPDELMQRIRDNTGDKSERFHGIVGALKGKGWNAVEIESLLSKYPNGVSERYIKGGRLLGEIERCFDKVDDIPPPSQIEIHPFEYQDPKTIPMRAWLYNWHYLRRTVSLTVAPGGTGKSSLKIIEALAMATGRNLVGITPVQRCRVWYWNGEEDQVEIERRFAASIKHYNIDPK
jgi:hypothetical protein